MGRRKRPWTPDPTQGASSQAPPPAPDPPPPSSGRRRHPATPGVGRQRSCLLAGPAHRGGSRSRRRWRVGWRGSSSTFSNISGLNLSPVIRSHPQGMYVFIARVLRTVYWTGFTLQRDGCMGNNFSFVFEKHIKGAFLMVEGTGGTVCFN